MANPRSALVVAAALLAVTFLTDAAKMPPKMWVRRPPPAGHKPDPGMPDMSGWPSPCKSLVTGYDRSCLPNDDFVMKLATLPEYKSYSPWAKSLIEGGIKGAECAKHTTYESCVGDKMNECYGNWPDGSCRSNAGDQIFANGVLCEGSLYKKSQICNNKLSYNCGTGTDGAQPDADGCVKSEIYWYGGKSIYDKTHEEMEKAMGGPYIGPYVCVLESELAAYLDASGEYNDTSYTEWSNEYAGDGAKGEADILRARGSCTYAKNSVTRLAYFSACTNLNINVHPSGYVKGLNQSDSAAMLGCMSNGCDMLAWNGTRVRELNGYEAGSMPDLYISCAQDNAVMWTTRLDIYKDNLLYKVQQACNAQYEQRNKAMCEAVKVV
ncbi:hypothetical protein HYH03_010340 [Edaphochlamys debaryana]|uniref:Uncharacterized protein n=1 Tax=Edaphochlamys debaryana TaxID=47281 RepID=A0A836BW41_9CHLO|nr:hypothetical protein HYH03_010340 [Edaphochlamys debaryana]|eukprot:KAG2491336.1 hypothetical protein HYH03_010340 [Edaphochlamys debaryana]